MLGHQVFGRPARDPERKADLFAGALLLPEEAMHVVFSAPIDLHRLAQIKGVWGVSMMAVLMRAKGMGVVDGGRFRSLYEVMRRKGWLKREPGDDRTVPEEPRLIKDLATAQGCPDPADLVFRLDFSLRDIRTFCAGVELDVPGSRQGPFANGVIRSRIRAHAQGLACEIPAREFT